MTQFGLFDYHKRLSRIDQAGDPLVELNEAVDWEQFRGLIERAREKPRKSPAGQGVRFYSPLQDSHSPIAL